MIEAVLFDWDGLTLDNEHIQSESYRVLLGEYGVCDPQRNEYGLVHTVGALNIMSELKRRYCLPQDTSQLVLRRQEIYSELIVGHLHSIVRVGLLQLLEVLKARGVKMAIVTSSPETHIAIATQALGIGHYYQAIVTGESVTQHKPHPDPYIKAAELLAVNVQDCLALEDSEIGVASASAAGMLVIAVPNRYTACHDFSHAHLQVNSLEEITWDLITTLANRG